MDADVSTHRTEVGALATQQREQEGSEYERTTGRAFTADEVATMVLDARRRVTVTAARHPRFSGLSEDDVEELFDATSEIVVGRADRYGSPEHVRASLWRGMELRALDVFRRRQRRGLELDQTALELVPDDLSTHDERITTEQELLVVRDFLAAMTVAEADVWKLVRGEELSVAAAAKQLGLSRHAVGEHLEAATRKLEVFLAIRQAGQWCGRRRSDIVRLLDGSDDEGTARRSMAHLRACGVCRREYAAQLRETGRVAAGVLPMPVMASGDHGRTIVERLADLLPFGGGSGRSEMIGGALLGSGGGIASVAKVGAVVATTATVAVGTGTVVTRDDRGAPEPPRRVAPVAQAPASLPGGAGLAQPVTARVVSSAGSVSARRTTATKTSSATTRAERRRRAERTRAAKQRAVERREDVFELGTVEPAVAPAAGTAASSPAPAPAAAAPPAPDPPGQESFLP